MSTVAIQPSLLTLIRRGTDYAKCLQCRTSWVRTGSGVCEPCRTVDCRCGRTFVSRKAVDQAAKRANRILCADCAMVKKNTARRFDLEMGA
jgi:hypothetical protein